MPQNVVSVVWYVLLLCSYVGADVVRVNGGLAPTPAVAAGLGAAPNGADSLGRPSVDRVPAACAVLVAARDAALLLACGGLRACSCGLHGPAYDCRYNDRVLRVWQARYCRRQSLVPANVLLTLLVQPWRLSRAPRLTENLYVEDKQPDAPTRTKDVYTGALRLLNDVRCTCLSAETWSPKAKVWERVQPCSSTRHRH